MIEALVWIIVLIFVVPMVACALLACLVVLGALCLPFVWAYRGIRALVRR